tara:strand:- start:11208 stop:11453 length:246 start_codon:yes stop_codon:yes gene_type:complete
MKKNKTRQIIREQIANYIKEEPSSKSFKASENDPSTSCIGRGICCINKITNTNIEAIFKMEKNRRIKCSCPPGSYKTTCEQ